MGLCVVPPCWRAVGGSRRGSSWMFECLMLSGGGGVSGVDEDLYPQIR